MSKPDFPQIPEGAYAADYVEGERVRAEDNYYGPVVRPVGGGQIMPACEAEGSWLNRKHRKK